MRAVLTLQAVLLLMNAGCGGEVPPPPSPDASADAGSSRASADSDDAGPIMEVAHEVVRGQTLWDIARAYDVSGREILERNSMSERQGRRLRPGMVLIIPGVAEIREVETAADRKAARESIPPPEDGVSHFLAAGETLWDLAHLYGVGIDELMERNALDDSDVRQLRAGRHLVIPGVTEEIASRIRQRPATAPRGVDHVLEPGETIWDLARRYGVSVSEIMARNRLSSADATRLSEGRRLIIPGVERGRSGKVARRGVTGTKAAGRLARKLGLGTRRAAGTLLAGRLEEGWLSAAGGKSGELPGRLRWPVANGWFVRGYGSGKGGYHLAVDIAGEIGWNVRAAAPGIVGYSGDEVRGYGNTVIVIHPGGWITLYAHNSVNFVAAGQRVTRGQILAELGSTGISRGPHVHFELLFRGQNCDPALLFDPGIRHRSGKFSPFPYTSWTDPGSRPRGVECHPRRRYPRGASVAEEASEPDMEAAVSEP